MRHEMTDFSMLDYRHLSAEERAAVKRWALTRAHAERSRALRGMLAGVAAFLRRLAHLTVQWWKAQRARRARSIAAADLRSLSDVSSRISESAGARSMRLSSLVGHRAGAAPKSVRHRTGCSIAARCVSPFSAPALRDCISHI